MSYYQADLAWVHHTGYANYVEATRAGIIQLLRAHGLTAGARVLDIGCGSGLLARELFAEGFAVCGIDASPAMIELARAHAPGAAFEVVKLPSGRFGGRLPAADAVVSTGHVLNYLDSRADIAAAFGELAGSVRPGGILAIDLMTERFCAARDVAHPHCKVEQDWAILTHFSRPDVNRFDRQITVFRRFDGSWRRSDEHHRNVTFEVQPALELLASHGITACARASFGDETLPEGLVVLCGAKA